MWTKISRFERPWPPFDFGSGMGLDDIDRDQAEQLGVVTPADVIAPQSADFNQGLQASVPDASPSILEGFKSIFGDQVDVGGDGKIAWQGQRILDLFAEARDPAVKRGLDLGVASPTATAQRPELEGFHLFVTADHARHLQREHPELTPLDWQLIPSVWRQPDTVRAGGRRDHYEFEAAIAGQRVLVEWERQPNTKRAEVRTYYRKEAPGA